MLLPILSIVFHCYTIFGNGHHNYTYIENGMILMMYLLIWQVYLKQILQEVCHYNTRNPHKNMWELKPEYQNYTKSSTKDES